MKVTLIQQTPNPIEKIAQYASICYDSDPKNPLKLVQHLYKNGHHSVFEHITFTFKIEGISRACSHQLVRHRHASYTQRSQRYCSESESEAIMPPKIAENPEAKAYYTRIFELIHMVYNTLIDEYKIPREDARYVLPNAMTTELYMTLNLRELIHLANERLCTRAQWEIRQMVKLMVEQVDPELRPFLVPKCEAGFRCPNPCGQKE